ncbi:bacteriocin immunity protein [Lactobacillus sp. ESL0791]|uniref:bacteriocin immunity protein n=1 Tax=Lactobacillus sp. ESL0791 TaxID=2983234 RepID=UPI0023F91C60|nr:bacteriocin immunity protein [Lactobacillus sp. ESL0791]MDF7639220.1 bacteriocin immunity protein [Lactobacillus sp. ESL0791]
MVKSLSNDQQQLIQEVYRELTKFYASYFSDTFNELNIGKYKQIRDAIGLVLRKFDSNDHPLEYTCKLIMYIQARVALYHLHLSGEQQQFMHNLAEKTKYTNLSFVYTTPIADVKQFI